MTRVRLRPLVVVTTALLLLGAAGCGSDGEGSTGTTDATDTTPVAGPSTTTGAATTSTSGSGGGEAEVRVYFVRDEAVATAGRSVPTPAVAGAALQALFAGPDDDEAALAMETAIPDGTRLNTVVIDDGTATADLSADFESGGGSLSMQLRVAQVVFTLTQFDSVDEVDIRLDGEAVDGIGGEGVPADDLTRDDFADVTPFILVESPVPGATVSSPVEVTGIANTFEANVLYELLDADGGVLDSGFTTATAGNGTWGDFSVEASFGANDAGSGKVVVYEESAEDGSRRSIYEVPVTIG